MWSGYELELLLLLLFDDVLLEDDELLDVLEEDELTELVEDEELLALDVLLEELLTELVLLLDRLEVDELLLDTELELDASSIPMIQTRPELNQGVESLTKKLRTSGRPSWFSRRSMRIAWNSPLGSSRDTVTTLLARRWS